MGTQCVVGGDRIEYDQDFFLEAKFLRNNQLYNKGELFDYSLLAKEEYQHCTIQTSKSIYFKNVKGQIQYSRKHQLGESDTQLFWVEAQRKNGLFLINSSFDRFDDRTLWQVANVPVRLCKGDLIKLGRVLFLVKEVQTQLATFEEQVFQSKEVCKICIQNQYTQRNPMLQPCNCAGSMGHIHLNCLKKYMMVHNSNPQERLQVCNLCNTPFNLTFIYRGQVINIDSTITVEPPYLILELLGKPDMPPQFRELALSFAEKKKLTLGRSHNVDFRIDLDISISRNHASLSFEKGEFLIEDRQSKFGTIVSIQSPRKLCLGEEIRVQIKECLFDLRAQGKMMEEIKVCKPMKQRERPESQREPANLGLQIQWPQEI